MSEDPISRKIRKRHSNIPQDGLFEMKPESKGKDESGKKKPARAKTVRYMPCPECTAQKVGVIKVYDQLRGMSVEILRDHFRVTSSKHRFQCGASGKEVG